MMNSSPGKPRARLSCFQCRRSKRRCDRVLPFCDLCIRNGIECSYPTRRGEKSSNDPEGRTAAATGLAAIDPATGSYYLPHNLIPVTESSGAAAAVSFIAPHVFQLAQLAMPRHNPLIPMEVAAHIGDTPSTRSMATVFFKTIHIWMPIISKKRFFIRILNPLSQRGPECSLLILCMKLCCTPPSSDSGDGRSPIYSAAKRFHFEVEAAGVLSVHVLQATVLIAIYEMGQAIYPAAFLTVGACARYGMALGIHELGQDVTGGAERQCSWLETEELRRAWWAVLVLDRLLNITNPVKRLSTDDPTFDSYLPVDDKAWDQGTTSPGDAVRLSAGFHLRMGLFARVAQATYLVSQALNASSTPLSGVGRSLATSDDTAQLRRTIFALVKTADTEAIVRQLEFCPQSSICYSAILLLQTHNTQGQARSFNNRTDESAAELFFETESALEDLSRMARELCAKWKDESCIADCTSLFLIQVVYQAASTLTRLGEGTPDVTAQERIEDLKELLRRLTPRWRVAGVYLSILASEEAIAAMAAI
ncbi:hypothetical protein GE09DRAFT_1088782 [Coniochaeta sp. 2T2.1]|nr:hypothetical protein GE09DRAFT_1088782 [Coniochaeta sp. 2T2.1]